MLIAWGTEEFERRNNEYVWAECDHCHRIAKLASYDAAVCSHFNGLKITTHREYHAIDFCPLCQHFREIPLGEWPQIVEQQVNPLIEDYFKNPDNSDQANQALEAVVMHRLPEHFNSIAGIIEKNFPDDPKILARMADAYALFFMDDEAVSAYSRSLLAHDDPGILYRLTYHLLYHCRVDDAHDEVWRYIDARDEYAKQTCLLYASACQAVGKHRDALKMLEHLMEISPETRQDSDVQEKLTLVKRYQGSEKRIGGRELAIQTFNKVPMSGKDRRIIATIATLVASVIFGVYLFLCVTAEPLVYLVGGTEFEYPVMIKGKEAMIPKQGTPRRLILDWGMARLEASPNGPKIDSIPLDMQVNFFLRAFSDRTWIINPDKSAIIIWTEVEYATYNPAPPVSKPYTGEIFYTFHDIEYPFKSMPKTIKTDANSTTRRQITLFVPQKSGSP